MEADMIIGIGILLFIIGCCISSADNANYENRQRDERRYRELMEKLSEKKEVSGQSKVTRRRIAKDKFGNIIAEEIVEEII
jgi:hypothetical protein